MTLPTVSVIVPSREYSESLARLLDSLTVQSHPADEVIIVSGDDAATRHLATRFQCRFFVDEGPGDRRSHARNLGANAARGELVLFLDGDMELPPNAIEECCRAVVNGAEAIALPERTEGTGLLGRVRTWERELVQGEAYLTFPRGIRRELFFLNGGFDETISGFEDLDLTARLMERGTRTSRTETAITHHEENVTLQRYLAKRLHYTEGARTYRQKHPAIAAAMFSPLARLKMYVNGVRTPKDLPLFSLAVGLRAVELFRVL